MSTQPVTPDIQPANVATDTLSGGVGGVNNVTPVAPPPAQAPPEHHSFMSDILHAVGEVLGGPSTKQQVNPQTGAVESVPLSRSQRIANTAGIYLRGAAAGAAQHGPGAVGKAALAGVQEQQGTQQQQFQNTQEESRNTQQQIMNRANIANQNNQALLAWRRYDMESADNKARIDKADSAFNLQVQEAGGTPVPMVVDGKDVNGGPDEDAIKNWWMQHPKPPDGMDYVPTRKTDANGKQTFTVLQVPHNAMNDMATISTQDAKDMGIPVKTSGDTVTMTRGAIMAARAAHFGQMNTEAEIEARKASASHAKAEEAIIPSEIQKNQATAGAEVARARQLKSQTFEEGNPLIDEVGQGKMPVGRLGYVLARKPELLAAVAAKYPDFDGSKIEAYTEAVKQFESTKPGTAGYAMNAGGTVLNHLHELDGLNTPKSHIYGTADYEKYQNKLDTVAAEIAKFYGDTTIPAIAGYKKTLGSTLPGLRHAAITTQVKSMGDKLDAYEQQWKNAAPSKAYQAQMPDIDAAGKAARAALDPAYAQRVSGQQSQLSNFHVNPQTNERIGWDGTKWVSAPAATK